MVMDNVYIGIQGNEFADQAAKDGLDKRITNTRVLFTDRKRKKTRFKTEMAT